MAKQQEEPKKKRLADRIEEEQLKLKEEFDKLPEEEKKALIDGQRRLYKKWDNQPWY